MENVWKTSYLNSIIEM